VQLKHLVVGLGLGLLVIAAGGCDAFFPSSNPSSTRFKKWESYPVALNSVGFLPDRAKRATFKGTATVFNVRRMDESVAHTGAPSAPVTDSDTGSSVSIIDFTALSAPGAYYVEIPGVGRSATFTIGPDIYRGVVNALMLGMYGQRCGTDVSFTYDGDTFQHKSCHMKDAYLNYYSNESTLKPSVGGWHDAGDYGKYTTNAAFSAGIMLMAWEHFPALATMAFPVPEHGGPIPDFLAEVKWEMDWLLTTQFADGRATHKVTATGFEGNLLPELDTGRRYFAPAGTAQTAALVASLAMAARIFQPFDAALAARYLTAAQLGYAYLTAHPADEKPDTSDFSTGGYGTSDPDDRLWAAAEMWETTGDPVALADFEARAGMPSVDLQFDWSNVQNLGLFTYALSKREGRNAALVDALKTQILARANNLASTAEEAGYGRAVGYWWGANGTVARTALSLRTAYLLDPQPRFLDAAVTQLDHLLGRNVHGRSYVTGVGHHPPQAPHHRPSVADGNTFPWPGLLVGGGHPTPMDWEDQDSDYQTNEIAINWTVAMIYAAAGMVP
jgi:endoglucanase